MSQHRIQLDPVRSQSRRAAVISLSPSWTYHDLNTDLSQDLPIQFRSRSLTVIHPRNSSFSRCPSEDPRSKWVFKTLPHSSEGRSEVQLVRAEEE